MSESFKFKSMDEIKAYVDSMRPHLPADAIEMMEYLFGLLENRAISEVVMLHGEEIKIDKFLAPIIVDLNSRGYQTLASCSGLQGEHPQEKFKPESGYLSIAFDKELLEFLQKKVKDPIIDVKEGEAYLKPSVSITIKSKDDSVLKEKWLCIWEALKEYR